MTSRNAESRDEREACRERCCLVLLGRASALPEDLQADLGMTIDVGPPPTRLIAISNPRWSRGLRLSKKPTSVLRNSEQSNPHPFSFGPKAGKTRHRPIAPRLRFMRIIIELRHDPTAQALRQILRLPDERLRFPSYGGHACARGLCRDAQRRGRRPRHPQHLPYSREGGRESVFRTRPRRGA